MIKKLLRIFLKIKGGLNPLPSDERDLGFWQIFGSEYKQKYQEKKLNPLTVKSQFFNTCGWTASTGAKEIDEGVELDERTLVMIGRREGKISGDGFSNLRDNEKMLQDFGVAEKGFLKDDFKNWDEFSNPKLLTTEIINNAVKHKTKTYLRIYKISEIYKAIDEGRPVKIGIDWATGFNQGEGFSFPYIIQKIIGWIVGGHALYIYGYNQNYKNFNVSIVRNSFGNDWGDKGDLYITEQFLQNQIDKYGAYINYDIDIDIAKWIINYQNKIIKTKNNPTVYLIEQNKKRKFTDLATFYAHGYLDENIITVDNEYFDKIEMGKDINFWDGKSVQSVKAIIQQRNNLKGIFSNYFNELFK